MDFTIHEVTNVVIEPMKSHSLRWTCWSRNGMVIEVITPPLDKLICRDSQGAKTTMLRGVVDEMYEGLPPVLTHATVRFWQSDGAVRITRNHTINYLEFHATEMDGGEATVYLTKDAKIRWMVSS